MNRRMRFRDADREVGRRTDASIERETAFTWCARAIACHQRARQTGSVAWLMRARSYEDEALEHAALVRDGGRLVARVQRTLNLARGR